MNDRAIGWSGPAAVRAQGRWLDLEGTACEYIRDWREQGLSDHSAIEAVLEPALA